MLRLASLAAADAASYSGVISSGVLVASGVAGGAAVSLAGAGDSRHCRGEECHKHCASSPATVVNSQEPVWGEVGEARRGDYGLDAGDAAARAGWLSKVRNVHMNPDEVRVGQYGVYDDAFMFRQGQDLVNHPDRRHLRVDVSGCQHQFMSSKNAQVFDH